MWKFKDDYPWLSWVFIFELTGKDIPDYFFHKNKQKENKVLFIMIDRKIVGAFFFNIIGSYKYFLKIDVLKGLGRTGSCI